GAATRRADRPHPRGFAAGARRSDERAYGRVHRRGDHADPRLVVPEGAQPDRARAGRPAQPSRRGGRVMTTAHLDPVTWERLAMRELPDGERQAALDHLLQCARCTAIYRSVLTLEESARSQGLGPAPSPMRRWRPIGLAAALAASAAFFAFWLAPRRIAD